MLLKQDLKIVKAEEYNTTITSFHRGGVILFMSLRISISRMSKTAHITAILMVTLSCATKTQCRSDSKQNTKDKRQICSSNVEKS